MTPILQFVPDSDDVLIDIKPRNEKNRIKPSTKGHKKVRVAVLTTTEFDALQVDPTTALFGPEGVTAVGSKVKDVDHDGSDDLVLRFKVSETGIQCGDTTATLTATTFSGQAVSGTDSVTTKGCKHRDDDSDSDSDSD